MHHARTTLEPGEVVHVVAWHEAPMFNGISKTTITLEATAAPGVQGFVSEWAGPKNVASVVVGAMGKVIRQGNRTRFFRFLAFR